VTSAKKLSLEETKKHTDCFAVVVSGATPIAATCGEIKGNMSLTCPLFIQDLSAVLVLVPV
jgi:hypothetical protein